MPLLEHLRELRGRLVRAVIALAAGCALSYIFADHLFALLTMPLREVGGSKLLLIGTGVGEAFFTKIKVALVAGVFVSSPAIFYEVWKFIAPGLLRVGAADGLAVRRQLEPVLRAGRLLLLGGGVQGRLRLLHRPVRLDRRHADDSHQRVPGVLGQADAGLWADLRDADFRGLPDPARTDRLPHDAALFPLRGTRHLRGLGGADSARHGFDFPARDSAAAALRAERGRLLHVPWASAAERTGSRASRRRSERPAGASVERKTT